MTGDPTGHEWWYMRPALSSRLSSLELCGYMGDVRDLVRYLVRYWRHVNAFRLHPQLFSSLHWHQNAQAHNEQAPGGKLGESKVTSEGFLSCKALQILVHVTANWSKRSFHGPSCECCAPCGAAFRSLQGGQHSPRSWSCIPMQFCCSIRPRIHSKMTLVMIWPR